ncbi:MAG: universal stress protein [Polyangiaceae bacterium]
MNLDRPTLFRNILVATDFSEVGKAALEAALLLSSERDTAQLHVMHVAAPAGDLLQLTTPDGEQVLSAIEAQQYLNKHVEEARMSAMLEGEPIESERVAVHVRAGDTEEEIRVLAGELEVDLLVVGTHGRRGFRHLVLGSVAESVCKKATCPVLVVRPKRYPARQERT